jgi:Asp-tRNA(Asn)/Glu-tRNA(Gln) amidotransferase B subunit
MSPSCAPSCAISAPATATWRRATCAPTSTSRCASPARRFGTRCEIKNVNSIRFIGQAVEVEARRQIGILEDGGKIDQETRLYDPGQGRDALDALEGRGA